MAKIRIVGDSSGYVELSAPNAAGNNTLELPSNATKLVGADASNSLSVTGIATFSGGIVVSAGSTAAPSISPSGDSNTGIFFPSPDTVAIGEGGVEVLRINSSGNVGINSTIPAAKLDIVGGSSQQFQVTGTEADIWLKSTGPGTIWRILGSTGGGTHRFRIYDQTNNLERFGIDSSGRVTMPYQPMFSAYRTSAQSITAVTPTKVLLDATEFNIGNYFDTSTSRFNVPITGIYLFTAAIQYNATGSPHTNLYKNGASFNDGWLDYGSGASSSGQSRVMSLTAGDFIELYGYHTSSVLMSQSRTRMTGFLIG